MTDTTNHDARPRPATVPPLTWQQIVQALRREERRRTGPLSPRFAASVVQMAKQVLRLEQRATGRS